MDSVSTSLFSSLQNARDDMVQQLYSLCSVNSGTTNLSGLAQTETLLAAAFSPLADSIESISPPAFSSMNMEGELFMQQTGNALLIRKRPELKRRVLLAGHMDTVFSPTHPFQHLTRLSADEINGPGVADMKGGLIVMQRALEAFEAMPAASSLGWDVLINADEEIGSPASSALIDDLAPRFQTALVYEPAMDCEGTLAKNRKGSGKLTLVATGQAAHAGRAFQDGRNAIAYLAEVICRVHALNGQREGVTINVGRVAGGEALNVVPDKAVCKLDIRIGLPSDEDWVTAQLQQIRNELKRDGYDLSIHGGFGRPVKRVCTGTTRLFQRIKRLSDQLGLPCDWKDSGGCCDGNNLARHGLPVIDTLGVRGGGIHSDREFILLDSLAERATLSALLLKDLAEGGLEELIS
ncbi:hydrolase [Legionella sp. CNM-4043-24]|uniref:hydrolase n=1 Tax=Legionella sp. CNM-4043-24 TaxID=3421646 RepID=UPI00403B2DB7